MPIKPKPRTYVCPSCGWKQSVFPASDVMGPRDHFDECPKCGSKELNQLEPSTLERLANDVLARRHHKGF